MKKKDSSDIGISYAPSSALPSERLPPDMGAQPLFFGTKTLIDLQTFEGCFILDTALASLLGVSISVLEAKAGNVGLSPEHRERRCGRCAVGEDGGRAIGYV